MQKLRAGELLLVEIIVYILLWIVNDYLASMLSLILAGICLMVLLFSLAAELIEKSNVPRWFFSMLVVSVLAPLIAAALFIGFSGPPSWLLE
ncbi:MAG: hypothetical protein DHS20C18_38640 [Saprospiraceae bacterium]|nr:MAG: hypothetical protein DHS20C18_38640 [Saprospiraceae bacterium]